MGLATEYFLADTEDMKFLIEYFDETGTVVKDDIIAEQIKLVLSDRDMLPSRRVHVKAYRERHAEDYK